MRGPFELSERRSSRSRSLGQTATMMPMIDVVFLLLVYFVWTRSFDPVELEVAGNVALPAETAPATRNPNFNEPPPEEEVVIAIRGDHIETSIELAGTVLPDLDTLRTRLESLVRLGVQPPLIIDPDPTVPMSRAIAVYDIADAAGVDQILFAVEAEP